MMCAKLLACDSVIPTRYSKVVDNERFVTKQSIVR
jgi:hypothetical protein